MTYSNRPRYIELLCDIFTIVDIRGGWHYIIIIPDGSTQNFIARVERFNFTPANFTFIEKSQFGGIN